MIIFVPALDVVYLEVNLFFAIIVTIHMYNLPRQKLGLALLYEKC